MEGSPRDLHQHDIPGLAHALTPELILVGAERCGCLPGRRFRRLLPPAGDAQPKPLRSWWGSCHRVQGWLAALRRGGRVRSCCELRSRQSQTGVNLLKMRLFPLFLVCCMHWTYCFSAFFKILEGGRPLEERKVIRETNFFLWVSTSKAEVKTKMGLPSVSEGLTSVTPSI